MVKSLESPRMKLVFQLFSKLHSQFLGLSSRVGLSSEIEMSSYLQRLHWKHVGLFLTYAIPKRN